MHFLVTVISKDGDYEKLMNRFDANLEVDYFVSSTKEDLKAEYENFMKEIIQDDFEDYRKNRIIKADLDPKTISFEKFVEIVYVDEKFDSAGNIIANYNPDGEYDWYVPGGRWENILISKKDGLEYDSLQIKDIDFKRMEEVSIEKAAKLWEDVQDPNNKTNYFYPIPKGMSKEEYSKLDKDFLSYALVTPDGKWHEKERLEISPFPETEEDLDKAWKKFIDETISNPEYSEMYITMVDCHI